MSREYETHLSISDIRRVFDEALSPSTNERLLKSASRLIGTKGLGVPESTEIDDWPDDGDTPDLALQAALSSGIRQAGSSQARAGIVEVHAWDRGSVRVVHIDGSGTGVRSVRKRIEAQL